jgi:hypothetical protein
MTTEKGQAWGSHGPAPPGTVLVASDAEARAAVLDAWRANRPLPTLALLGGDLCRTLGGRGDQERLRSAAALRAPIDLAVAVLDGVETVFVSHLVARRRWWKGRIFLAMNAEYLGRWDVAPRSHPNDGLLDTVDLDLSFGDRVKAWRRLRSGAHVPHPGIEQRRVSERTVRFDPPLPVAVDGVDVGAATEIRLRVLPDALTVVV